MCFSGQGLIGSSVLTKSRRKIDGVLYYLLYLKEWFFFFSPTAFVHILWEGGCKVSESSFLHEFLKHELLKVKIPLAIRIDTWGFKSALN